MNTYTTKEIACSVSLETGIEIRYMETCNGFKQFKSHWHDYMELIFVTQGTIHIKLDNREKLVAENELIIIPPQQLHEGIPGLDGVKVYSIFLDIDALSNKTFISNIYFKPLLEGKISFIDTTSRPEIIKTVTELINSSKTANSIYTQGKVYELIGLIFELSDSINKNTFSTKMQKILEYIQIHYAEDISSSNICTEFGYTESHLCRLFKKHTGVTISKYVQTLRIENAKKLLQETDMDISRISETCGFLDFSYFCRCFKSFVRFSPSDFRKKMKEKK